MRRFIVLICLWISLDGSCLIAILVSLISQGLLNLQIQKELTHSIPVEYDPGDADGFLTISMWESYFRSTLVSGSIFM